VYPNNRETRFGGDQLSAIDQLRSYLY